MVEYLDECCGCATESYPCMGSACSMRNVPHYFCDKCKDEFQSEELYVMDDGQELCQECLLAEFPTVADRS